MSGYGELVDEVRHLREQVAAHTRMARESLELVKLLDKRISDLDKRIGDLEEARYEGEEYGRRREGGSLTY